MTLFGRAYCIERGLIAVVGLAVFDDIGTFAATCAVDSVALDTGENILFLLCKFCLQIY